MDKNHFKQKVEEYLLKDPKNANINSVNFDTHLWDAGLVDSFRMIELVMFLEDLLDIEINVENNFISSFHTIQKMCDKLLLKTE